MCKLLIEDKNISVDLGDVDSKKKKKHTQNKKHH